MPFGFPPPLRPKRLLLFSNANTDKKINGKLLRKTLAVSLRRQAAALNLSARVQLAFKLVKPAAGPVKPAARPAKSEGSGAGRNSTRQFDAPTAAATILESVFCLCPSGDIAGFTARLYFSIIHRCIPVYVDLHPRLVGFDDLAFPFPRSINWSRVVLFRREVANLVSDLAAISDGEIASRQHYMQSIAHLLVYDLPAGGEDAASAFIRELEHRFLGSDGARGAAPLAVAAGAGGEYVSTFRHKKV